MWALQATDADIEQTTTTTTTNTNTQAKPQHKRTTSALGVGCTVKEVCGLGRRLFRDVQHALFVRRPHDPAEPRVTTHRAVGLVHRHARRQPRVCPLLDVLLLAVPRLVCPDGDKGGAGRGRRREGHARLLRREPIRREEALRRAEPDVLDEGPLRVVLKVGKAGLDGRPQEAGRCVGVRRVRE